MGVEAVPGCFTGFACKILNGIVKKLVYTSLAQNWIAPAGYFRDVNNLKTYLKDSVFLPASTTRTKPTMLSMQPLEHRDSQTLTPPCSSCSMLIPSSIQSKLPGSKLLILRVALLPLKILTSTRTTTLVSKLWWTPIRFNSAHLRVIISKWLTLKSKNKLFHSCLSET